MTSTAILSSAMLFVAGLVFFLYGMNVLSDSLERLAGGKMEKTLRKITDSPIKGLLLGAGITAVIQSSSATTVMLVGLVNSGIMTLTQSIGVIMGSNIGTTVTAWIVALAGVDGGDSLLLTLVKPSIFSPALALVGIAMIMISNKPKRRVIGTIMVSFAVLIFGLEMMGDAIDIIPEETFMAWFAALNHPLIGLLIGIVVTAIIQSSSASIGILQTVALKSGTLPMGMAIPIIFGQNIGTCVTAMIAAVGANKNGKRVCVVHLASKVIGTVVFMIPYYLLMGVLADFFESYATTVSIAVVHTGFNILNTVLLMPFCGWLEKFARKVVRENVAEHPVGYLDERLLKTPSVATVESKRQAVNMAKLSRDSMLDALSLLDHYDETLADKIAKDEGTVDEYEDTIGSYLVKLSALELTDHDAANVSKMLLSIGDFERLSDHALMVLRAAKEMHEKELSFSPQAQAELKPILAALGEILRITVDAFDRSDLELAKKVEPLEQVMDKLIAGEKARHIERLQKGLCTIELGFILNDLLTSFQRVSDHCSNVAVCLIQTKRDAFETHSYLNEVKGGDEDFTAAYKEYKAVYFLPPAQ